MLQSLRIALQSVLDRLNAIAATIQELRIVVREWLRMNERSSKER